MILINSTEITMFIIRSFIVYNVKGFCISNCYVEGCVFRSYLKVIFLDVGFKKTKGCMDV